MRAVPISIYMVTESSVDGNNNNNNNNNIWKCETEPKLRLNTVLKENRRHNTNEAQRQQQQAHSKCNLIRTTYV